MRAAPCVGNWHVVRFAPTPAGGVAVLAEDAPALKAFLGSVLERKRKRLGSGSASGTAGNP